MAFKGTRERGGKRYREIETETGSETDRETERQRAIHRARERERERERERARSVSFGSASVQAKDAFVQLQRLHFKA